MKYCKQCNEILTDDVVFCPKCGCKVDAPYSVQSPQNIISQQKKTNVCSILAIIFGAIGIIPILNFLFLPVAIVLAIIGAILSKNRKKGVTVASAIVVVISLIISILWLSPIFSGKTITPSTPTESPEIELQYTEIYEDGRITTDFVTITIDELSTAKTIYSIDSSVVFNSDTGEEYFYISGTITNTSNYTYDIGSLGSSSYGNTDTMIDCNFEMSNGESEYGVLLTDDGSFYGLSSDGIISPQETVRYYFIFTIQENAYLSGKITMAFTDGFSTEPSYDHSNCEYLYEIKVD